MLCTRRAYLCEIGHFSGCCAENISPYDASLSPKSMQNFIFDLPFHGNMKFVRISQAELVKIKELYEGVMSHACHGLFFREGAIFGTEIANEAMKDKGNYFQIVAMLIKNRGWVDNITFKDNEVIVNGSIEVTPSEIPTCHRLRGLIRQVYESYYNTKVHCVEVECESTGKDKCVFKIESI